MSQTHIRLIGMIATLLALDLSLAAAQGRTATPPTANKLTMYADRGKETIHRNIYGHFAEHLGRCIYEGFWVGEQSSIPNTRGIRNDVVAAAMLMLDSWAINDKLLYLDLPRDAFAAAGKLHLWFLRGDTVLWKETLDWPGYGK